MGQYNQTMDAADAVFVLYDSHVFELKRMPVPSAETIKQRLGDVEVYNDANELKLAVKKALLHHEGQKTVLLLMSSGNLAGLTTQDFIG